MDYGEDADLEPEDAPMAEQDGGEAAGAPGEAALAGAEAEAAEAAPATDAAQAAAVEPGAAAPVPSEGATGAAGEGAVTEAAPGGEQASRHPNTQPVVLTGTQSLSLVAISIRLVSRRLCFAGCCSSSNKRDCRACCCVRPAPLRAAQSWPQRQMHAAEQRGATTIGLLGAAAAKAEAAVSGAARSRRRLGRASERTGARTRTTR